MHRQKESYRERVARQRGRKWLMTFAAALLVVWWIGSGWTWMGFRVGSAGQGIGTGQGLVLLYQGVQPQDPTDGPRWYWWFHWRHTPWGPVQSGSGNVGVPLWFPFLLLLGLVIRMWRADDHAPMRGWWKYAFYRCPIPDTGRCQWCGYDLTGNTTGICPECGRRWYWGW